MIERVVVIGLDGASPTLIERWQDDLPNLRRLMAHGAWGTLRSTIPHYTLPAWPSMFTGVNPGKLGIFGFRRRLPGTYRFGFSNMARSPAPAVWDILSEEGRPSGVIGVPGTFPPWPIQGFLISGFPAPANDGRLVFTHPESLSRQLDKQFGLYELEVYETYQPGREQEFLDACERVGRMQWEATLRLVETQPWDFLVVVSLTIDRISHYFWRFMDENHPEYTAEGARQWGHVLRDIYRQEDAFVGRLLERVPDNTLVIVASDHGFCGRHRVFYINEWLRRRGYLHLKAPIRKGGWLGRLMNPIVAAYQRYGWVRAMLAPLRRTAARDRALAAHHAFRHGEIRLENAPVDWQRTIAYALDQHRIYLNVQGREPAGPVAASTYDEVLSRLEDELRGLTDEDGRSLAVEIHRGKDVYHGPFTDEAPDIVLFLDDYHCDLNISLGKGVTWGPAGRLSGVHHPDGVVVLHGPGVQAGQRLQANIVDIAATVLHALDAPIPAECDGRPLQEAFSAHSDFRQRPPREGHFSKQSGIEHTWSEEEESQVMKRLQDLGYL